MKNKKTWVFLYLQKTPRMDPSTVSLVSLTLVLDLLGRKERDIVDNIRSTLESRSSWERDLATVTHDGRALQYASESLKNDREVVRAAAGY